MPGQRRSASSRSRRSWLPVLAGVAAIVLVAGGGTAAYLIMFHSPSQARTIRLPTGVASTSSVGLVAGASGPGSQKGELVQLLPQQGSLAFMPVSKAEAANGQPQWTADQMAGGTYIFIYVPTGQCLSETGTRARHRLAVRHCDLSMPQQRWRRLTAVPIGQHAFYEFANYSSGRCISQTGTAGQPGSAGLASCDPSNPASELLSFWWTAQ